MITVRVWVAGFVLATAFCHAPDNSAQEPPLIRLLQIEGTRRPLDLATPAGQPLDPARIERDVRQLWTTGWFEDIRVETTDRSDGVDVKFVLAESSRLHLREVKFEPRSQRRAVALQPGTRIDKVLAAQAAGELRRQLVAEGHTNAEVRAELVPAGIRQADLLLRVDAGRALRVNDVEFAGEPGLDPKELRKALKATLARRILPGLGPLWGGRKRRAAFSDRALQEDAERLRSLYFSRGYFDASVQAALTEIADSNAAVTFRVFAGPRYDAERVEVAEHSSPKSSIETLESFPLRELCRCFVRARRESERRGELGFAAQLEIVQPRAGPVTTLQTASHADAPPVTLRARISTGAVHRVGRIEFQGHRSLSDRTLHRALAIEEGSLFDPEGVRRSLARLSRIAGVEPLSLSDVEARPDARERLVHLTIQIKEKPRGRWAISGPLGPLNALGPVQFMVASRLPGAGSGPLELSTHYVSFSLLAYASPWTAILPTAARLRWIPLVSWQRPYLPGQEWQSGFLVSPRLSGRETAATFALTQGNERLRRLLRLDVSREPGLTVPVSWSSRAGGETPHVTASRLRCEPERGTLARLAGAGAWMAEVAASWVLTAKVL